MSERTPVDCATTSVHNARRPGDGGIVGNSGAGRREPGRPGTTTLPSVDGSLALFDPAILADPYPRYEHLRSAAPIYWNPTPGYWVLTRYADALLLLRDPRFSADRVASLEHLRDIGLEEFAALFRVVSKMMLFTDPPAHTRLRSLVSKAFTPRAVDALRSRIQGIVDDLLENRRDQDSMDIIRDLAYPLPTIVIAALLGVPAADQEHLKAWSDDVAAFLGNLSTTTEQKRRAQHSIAELRKYFQAIGGTRHAGPSGMPREPVDLLHALAGTEDQNDRLTEEEALANAILLLAAGHETTTNLIGNGLLALLRHPDQIERLRQSPELIDNAVEELLRYDSPVQMVGRRATDDIHFQNHRIRRDQLVIVVLGAANRDPARFAEPDQLDIGRSDIGTLAFGRGNHFCLGAPLARLEARIAIATILRRFPHLELTAASPQWRSNFALRGLQTLSVRLHGPGRGSGRPRMHPRTET